MGPRLFVSNKFPGGSGAVAWGSHPKAPGRTRKGEGETEGQADCSSEFTHFCADVGRTLPFLFGSIHLNFLQMGHSLEDWDSATELSVCVFTRLPCDQ